jgi:hypothetical protein
MKQDVRDAVASATTAQSVYKSVIAGSYG